MPGPAVPDPGGRSSVPRSSTTYLRYRTIPAAIDYDSAQSLVRADYQCTHSNGVQGAAGTTSSGVLQLRRATPRRIGVPERDQPTHAAAGQEKHELVRSPSRGVPALPQARPADA